MKLINKPYKLLVSDIDGTLLNRDGNISPVDIEALAEVVRSGIPVSLSTGRVVLAAQKFLDQLSLDGSHIFFDGALVFNPSKGEEVYVDPIPEELVREMTELSQRIKVNLDLFSLDRFFVERESWVSEIRRQFFGLEVNVVDFGAIWQQQRIIKGTLVAGTDQEKAEVEEFCRYFGSRLAFSLTRTPAYPDIDFTNVIAAGASKGKALEALASHLGIALSQVAAIGDGNNDLSLLSRAGLSIAMGNASDELKAVSDQVTLDVEHNGVAAALKKFLL